MKKRIAIVALLWLTSTAPVCAAEPANSVQEQQSLARRLGEKVQRFEMWTDDEGNVTGLIFINHQALTRSAGEKPGVNDDDLARLAGFPKLTAVNFEGQPIGDRGLAVLKRFPGLKQAGFHYMAKAEGASASPDFITVVDGMRDLEILEIKHNFKMPAINVHKLKGTFPKVWRLVLDTPLSAEQTMHLVSLCPNVTDLQLHRSPLSAEQLSEFARRLPKLEVLWWKPKGRLLPEHLTAIKGFTRLRIFSPQHFKNSLDYEQTWRRLAEMPSLERLEIAGDGAEANRAALQRLKTARPDLVIDSKLTRSRNYEGL
ncbi:MAG: hypothetical protein RIC55_00965 [Pirellulaceae bacterium]